MQQNFTQIQHFEPNKEPERQSSKSVYYPPAPEPVPVLDTSPLYQDNLPSSGNAVRNLNSVFGDLPTSNPVENPSYLSYSGSYTAITDAPLASAQSSPLYCFDPRPLVIDESSDSSEHSDILDDDWFEKISDVLCKEF